MRHSGAQDPSLDDGLSLGMHKPRYISIWHWTYTNALLLVETTALEINEGDTGDRSGCGQIEMGLLKLALVIEEINEAPSSNQLQHNVRYKYLSGRGLGSTYLSRCGGLWEVTPTSGP
jgi:hypothetical protein